MHHCFEQLWLSLPSTTLAPPATGTTSQPSPTAVTEREKALASALQKGKEQQQSLLRLVSSLTAARARRLANTREGVSHIAPPSSQQGQTGSGKGGAGTATQASTATPASAASLPVLAQPAPSEPTEPPQPISNPDSSSSALLAAAAAAMAQVGVEQALPPPQQPPQQVAAQRGDGGGGGTATVGEPVLAQSIEGSASDSVEPSKRKLPDAASEQVTSGKRARVSSTAGAASGDAVRESV